METLKIYRIEEKYIRYLHSADSRVQYNKGQRRPYVGIVLVVGSYQYFVPMESPKPNHQNIKPRPHLMPLEGGKYGLLGFNNMIPVHSAALVPFDFRDEPDLAYRSLLENQYQVINDSKAEVLHRASKTYFTATNSKPGGFIRKICCDFKKLERAADRYNPNYVPKSK